MTAMPRNNAERARIKNVNKKINPTGGRGAKDRLTPGEVAVLSRVVRAHIIPAAALVSSWGMGPWAAQALDGLLKRGLVGRGEEVSQFVGQEGFPSKPGPWIVPTKAGINRMRKELDIAFPPFGELVDVRRRPVEPPAA